MRKPLSKRFLYSPVSNSKLGGRDACTPEGLSALYVTRGTRVLFLACIVPEMDPKVAPNSPFREALLVQFGRHQFRLGLRRK
jgi:hypothetical protein